MRRLTYPAGALLVGLAVSHLLFTVLVYVSNRLLYVEMTALKAAGYLVVPNDNVIGNLFALKTAFFSALFFTLTIGAGLSLLAFAGGWIFSRVFKGHRYAAAVLFTVWIALAAAVNANGFNAVAIAAVLIIPVPVFFMTIRWMPGRRSPADWMARVVHVIVIVAVAAAWVPRLDDDVFINIRDYLLLENPAGKAVNNFYYKYTLYPAELFKTLEQKLLKPVNLVVQDSELEKPITDRLLKHDYLPVSADGPFDLSIKQDGEDLVFSSGGHIMRTGLSNFLKSPETKLSEFSRISDTDSVFRLLTFYCLLIAFPLSLYVIVHALIGILLAWIPAVNLRSVIASIVCMAIGIAAVVPLYSAPAEQPNAARIDSLLSSGDWVKQRNAFKAISDLGIDPFRFDWDRRLLYSDHVTVRYWLARSLSNSPDPQAYGILTKLAGDPHPNVACQAFYSLGRSSSKQAVQDILIRMAGIRHWYVQWYAYKSLKRLGWVQKKSDSISSHLP